MLKVENVSKAIVLEKIEVVAVAESMLTDVQDLIGNIESMFPLNHPMRKSLSDARMNFNSVVKQNRQNPPDPQTNWVYIVESKASLCLL